MNELKEDYPHLKTLLAVGGWSLGTASMSAMLATPETRNIFIQHSHAYLRYWGFDGLSMDFQYPGAADKEKYALLTQVRP